MMLRVRSGWTIALAATLLLAMACGEGGDSGADEARQAALASLEEMKVELDAKRQELQELRARLAAEPSETEEAAAEEEAGTEEGEGEAAPDLATQVETLENEVLEMADGFGSELVSFINEDPPIIGEEMNETQLAAIRMKSGEDMVAAMTYIDEGGDYKRAIRIYEAALDADPDNEELKAALAEAEAMRFMTPERFAEVKDGMTQPEVRGLLGQVNLRNIREYPDKDIVAWFYPTAEDGSAAGIFFRKRRGEYVVYEVNFEAVKPKTTEEE